MQKVNHPLKARMYVGGLKSLLVDIASTIEEIENSGNVPQSFVENLVDLKEAIDLTVNEFKKVVVKCCDHGEGHDSCSEECDEDDPEDDDELYCEECGVSLDGCVCKEEEEPPPPPPRKVPAKKLPRITWKTST